MKTKCSLIIKNAGELVTLDDGYDCPRQGDRMNHLEIIKDGGLAITQNRIVATGPSKQILTKYTAKTVIDARAKTVTPGLIDSHTHPVFAGDRSAEFEMKLKGATYQEIARAGGGIISTVRATRPAAEETLKKAARKTLARFLASGTTTIEAKSGYGLNLKDEIKILEVIRGLNHLGPIEIVPTFLGAHEIPPEYKNNKPGYIKLIKEKMLPVVARWRLAEFCDVFCEKDVFEIAETRGILTEAKKYGLGIKLHADEFAPLGGAELAASLGATSADHLMAISAQGIQTMKDKGVIAVLLPGTTFALGLSRYAPARRMIDDGLAVALATDFNPGTSFTESLPLIMTLGCVMMRMTPAEVLTAVTVNAAYAINRGAQLGRLAVGKQADIIIWDAPTYKHLPYHFGVNLTSLVIKKGKIIIRSE